MWRLVWRLLAASTSSGDTSPNVSWKHSLVFGDIYHFTAKIMHQCWHSALCIKFMMYVAVPVGTAVKERQGVCHSWGTDTHIPLLTHIKHNVAHTHTNTWPCVQLWTVIINLYEYIWKLCISCFFSFCDFVSSLWIQKELPFLTHTHTHTLAPLPAVLHFIHSS